MPRATDAMRPDPSRRKPSAWRGAAALLSLLMAVLSIAQEAPPEAAPPAAVPSHRQAENVAVITIAEDITRVTAASFLRRLELAEQAGADAVVVELDTNGGEVGAVLEICDEIRKSPITNSVAWIHSKAYSGGAIIALACKEIVSASPARMGDALPIFFGPGGIHEMADAERQKQTAPIIAEVVGSARLRGWDEYVVQGFASLGVELWWVRDVESGEEMAISEPEYRMLFDGDPPRTRPMLAAAPNPDREQGAADAEAPSEPLEAEAPQPGDTGEGSEEYRPASPALEGLDVAPESIGQQSRRETISPEDKGRYELVGYLSSGDGPLVLQADEMAMLGFASNVGATGALSPIQTDQDLAAFFGAKNIRRLDPTWSESLVRIMSHNVARGVLIVVFLIALFLEMSHPGIGLPGAIAAAALIGLLAPPALIGMANWWEIGAIFLGILLIVVEIFITPGFGVPGIAGLLLLFGGLLGTFVGDTPGGLFPNSPRGQSDLIYGLVTLFMSTATAGFGMYFLAKHFGSLPLVGSLVLKDVSGGSGSEDDLLAEIPVGADLPPKQGSVGVSVTPLRPSGRAQVGDRVIDVVADIGYIEAGRNVRIVSADRFRVVVEEIAGDGGHPGGMGAG